MMASVLSSQCRFLPWSVVLGMFCIVVTLASPDEVFVPDLSFTSQSVFKTEMVNEDLDAARKQEIKSQLEPQLADVFKNITGFKGVEVTMMTINELEKLLVTNWTVRLNRNDPKFMNSTPEEIGNIVRSELEAASKRYKDSIVIDTSRHPKPPQPGTEDYNNNLALGLGLGLGLGIPVLAAAILTIVLLARRKKRRTKKPLSISDVTSSHNSDGSSKMDERNYMPGPGGFIPSISGKSAPSSVSGRSDYITPVIYDTLSLSAPSVASGGYAVLNDNPGDRSLRSNP